MSKAARSAAGSEEFSTGARATGARGEGAEERAGSVQDPVVQVGSKEFQTEENTFILLMLW